MEICKECGSEFNSIKSLAMHVSRTHLMSSEDYYLKYIGIKGICSCGNPTKYRNMVDGYSKHCSSRCAYHDTSVANKRESTMIELYGVIYAGSSDKIRNRIKNTLIEKYGVETTFQSDEIRQKSRNTVKSRYGVDNVMSLESVQEKRKVSSLEKYGTEHPIQNINVQHKSQHTMLRNHGVCFPAQSPEIKATQRQTSLKRYGVPVATQSSDIKRKIADTNIERYGYTTPLKNPIVKRKSEQTCQIKYGVHHPGASVESHKKRHVTTLAKYGVENVTSDPIIKDKMKSTLLLNYGVENPMQSERIRATVRDTNMKRYGVVTYLQTKEASNCRHATQIRKMIDKYSKKLQYHNCELIDSYYNNELRVKYKCNHCGSLHDESWQFFVICRMNINVSPCIVCKPKKPIQSHRETEVYDYVRTICPDATASNRDIINPQELDIVCNSRQLAIEFNGLYYHSEVHKPNDYHVNKTDLCNRKGIQLIHIYEDDWLYKTDIVKSRINNLLGISNRIYARKCIVKEVGSKDANRFLETNHIQGKCRSKYRYGLYYNNELISLMTFGISRFADEYELIRFCNKLNTTVIGGASKLFKYFTRLYTDINSIISYADRSWSIGGLYEQLGFTLNSITKPGYSYVNGNVRENRMKYQKHKLVSDGYDKDMTEHEIMLSRKLYRIYDSGHLKYIWTR